MNKKLVGFISILFLLLTACGRRQQDLSSINTTNILQLENVQIYAAEPGGSTSVKQTTLSQIRIRSLNDSAMSMGAQGGLAWASEQINVRLVQDRKYLDSIFNFNAMMLNHGVMPPVLEQGDNTLNLADPNTIRISDKTYKIIKQAYFATTPPNWREYIWLSYSKPELPDRTLLPRSNEEHIIWKKGIRAGWEKGIEQAYSIFQQSLARLKRDYRGMLLYRKLLQEKMISPPFVSTTQLGVTGDGTDMRINDQVLRIVEHPQLQTNSRHWKAIVVKK